MASRWRASLAFRSFLRPAVLDSAFAAHRTQTVLFPFHSSILFRSKTRPRTWNSNLLWFFPIAGGVFLCLSPNPKPHLPTVFASPTLIPCPTNQHRLKNFTNEDLIGSPAEPHLSIASQILYLLQEYVWEPILTTRRFIHLFYLFVPVFATIPMLLIGRPERELEGDRWGAVWWYGLLVSRMQAAGPTFIKVNGTSYLYNQVHTVYQLAQWASSRPDLFPTLLCDKMGAMHSRGKPHQLECTVYIIEKVFQRPFEEIFEEFDETPIGTGAIAQVYQFFKFLSYYIQPFFRFTKPRFEKI